jgi:phosphoribosylanthranilate isomerase
MALKIKVKVSRVSNLSDARYCAGMGVEWIGFNLDPTLEQTIDLKKWKEISEWISGVKLVGEFGFTPAHLAAATAADFKPDYIQLEDYQEVASMQIQADYNLMLKLDIRNRPAAELEEIMKKFQDDVDFFVLYGRELPEADTKKLMEQFPVIWGTVSSKNLDQLLTYPIQGIEISGSDEIKPGLKDFDDLAEILEALEIDDVY